MQYAAEMQVSVYISEKGNRRHHSPESWQNCIHRMLMDCLHCVHTSLDEL